MCKRRYKQRCSGEDATLNCGRSDSELEGPNSRQRGLVVGLDGDRGFHGLKLKLISSIVAISGISLLRSFLKIGDGPLDEAALKWRVIIHLTFVVRAP